MTDLPTARNLAELPARDVALEWAAAGFRVFPVRGWGDNPKHPFKGFKWNREASNDLEVVTALFDRYSTAEAVGVIPGSGGCVVVDVDDPEAAERLGEDVLPPTYRVRTPSGNYHLWYRHPDAPQIGNSDRDFGKGINIRAGLGYALAAGSRGYEVEDDTPAVEAPAGLVERLRTEADPADLVEREREPASPRAGAEDAGWALVYPLAGALEGDRHAAGLTASAGLADLVALSVLTEQEAVRRLEWAASRNGYEQEQRTHELLRMFRDDLAGRRVAGKPEGLVLTDWGDVFAAAEADPDWLVDGVLEAGTLTALVAPAKEGKTLLAQEIAWTMATGGGEVGGRPVAAGRVLYVDEENTLRDWGDRLRAMGQETPDGLTDLRLVQYTGLDLVSPDGARRLVSAATDHGVALVVLDTYSRFRGLGAENDADPYQTIYRQALAPLKAAGIAVLRLDHTGKDKSKGARGSSAKADDVDVEWTMAAVAPGSSTLRMTKTRQRQGHGLREWYVQRGGDPLRHRPVADGAQDPEQDPVAHAVRVLDEHAVPEDAGRDAARAILREAGAEGIGNATLGAAQQRRRERRDNPGQGALL